MSRFSAGVAPEDLGHVEQPALAEDRDDRRLGRDELAGGSGPPRAGSTRWRVEPKAASRAVCQVIVLAAAKKSMSLGFEPGQPPSMYGMPNSSSIRAIRSLSASDRMMFSPWVPSRRVVS